MSMFSRTPCYFCWNSRQLAIMSRRHHRPFHRFPKACNRFTAGIWGAGGHRPAIGSQITVTIWRPHLSQLWPFGPNSLETSSETPSKKTAESKLFRRSLLSSSPIKDTAECKLFRRCLLSLNPIKETAESKLFRRHLLSSSPTVRTPSTSMNGPVLTNSFLSISTHTTQLFYCYLFWAIFQDFYHYSL